MAGLTLVHLVAEQSISKNRWISCKTCAELRRGTWEAYGKAPSIIHLRKEFDASALAAYNGYYVVSKSVSQKSLCGCVSVRMVEERATYGVDQESALTTSQHQSTSTSRPRDFSQRTRFLRSRRCWPCRRVR
jgi:hypothetical protein